MVPLGSPAAISAQLGATTLRAFFGTFWLLTGRSCSAGIKEIIPCDNLISLHVMGNREMNKRNQNSRTELEICHTDTAVFA